MIVVDVETSGTDRSKSSLLSIGAVHLETGAEFYVECQFEKGCTIDPEAMKINGFTLDQISDPKKPTPQEAYQMLEKWSKTVDDRLLGGQNIAGFDVLFLHRAFDGTFSMNWHFQRRTVDLHSVAYARFRKSMTMDEILKALGLEEEPKPHNALTGARLEAEAFRRLLKPREPFISPN